MAEPTIAEMIASCKEAIKAITDGGAVVRYSIGGRSLERASLADLLKLWEQLKAGNVPTGGFRTFVEFVSTGQGASDA